MFVVLSQRIDSPSDYDDDLFKTYHYPARYKNQLQKGDMFVYYQGNRYDKSQRYYFGFGTVGDIQTTDGENYYANLLKCQAFEKNVPIYLPDHGYIEQLGYSTVRKSLNPPWQSSVRPLSSEAFAYILHAAGINFAPDISDGPSVEQLKESLKESVRDFFVEGDPSAIYRIENISAAIGHTLAKDHPDETKYEPRDHPVSEQNRFDEFLAYCQTMKMSYSYKPLLILALLYDGDQNGAVHISKAAQYFRDYYNKRRAAGLRVEKKKCIYLRADITDEQIMGNIIANPVQALVESGFFLFNETSLTFSFLPEIRLLMDDNAKTSLAQICSHRLDMYFED